MANRELDRVERMTAHCDRMTLCLALDYGGQWDLGGMLERVRELERQGKLGSETLTPAQILEMLPSGAVPPVDLLIRTGGDSRISNFLPWQLAYAEMMFVAKLWPDFGREDLLECYERFSQKDRRFGRIRERLPEPAGEEQPT